MKFVLDNSVSMRWLIPSEKKSDQQYAQKVLKSMNDVTVSALVPSIWHLEASNAMLVAERNGTITTEEADEFALQLEDMYVTVDSLTWTRPFGQTMTLARIYDLSSYDAAYLELAVRKSASLATLDKALIKAARKAGVEIYLKEEKTLQ